MANPLYPAGCTAPGGHRYPLWYRVAIVTIRVCLIVAGVLALLLAFLLLGEERPARPAPSPTRPSLTPAERAHAFRNPNLNWQDAE